MLTLPRHHHTQTCPTVDSDGSQIPHHKEEEGGEVGKPVDVCCIVTLSHNVIYYGAIYCLGNAP